MPTAQHPVPHAAGFLLFSSARGRSDCGKCGPTTAVVSIISMGENCTIEARNAIVLVDPVGSAIVGTKMRLIPYPSRR